MTARRPATDLVQFLLEDVTAVNDGARVLFDGDGDGGDRNTETETETDGNRDLPEFRSGGGGGDNDVRHPAVTDFGLDSLTAFIREEFRKREVERYRRLEAGGLKNRVGIRACRGRSVSAPSSKGEGDGESNAGQIGGRCGLSRLSEAGPSSGRDAYSRCSRNSVHDASDAEAAWSVGTPLRSSSSNLQSRTYRRAVLQPQSDTEALSAVRSHDRIGPGCLSNVQSSRSSTEGFNPLDSSTTANRNTANETVPVNTARTNLARSVSFEKHTDQVRRSSRAANEGLEQIAATDDNKADSLCEGEDKSRRSANGQDIPRLVSVGTASNLMSSEHGGLDNALVDSITSQSVGLVSDFDIQDQPSPATTVDGVFSGDESATTSSDDCELRAETNFNKGHTGYDQASSPPKQRMFRKPPDNGRLDALLDSEDNVYLALLDAFDVISDSKDEEFNLMASDDYDGHSNSSEVDDTDVNAKRPVVPVFEYNRVVPEQLPDDLRLSRANSHKIWTLLGSHKQGQSKFSTMGKHKSTHFTLEGSDPERKSILEDRDKTGQYPTTWDVKGIPKSSAAPPECPARSQKSGFPAEILPLVCQYLSSQEVRNLRLVNRVTSSILLPLVIRSAVVKFGKSLFEPVDGTQWDSTSDDPATGSILRTNGPDINKFGISFELDTVGLINAQPKKIEEEVHAWFGTYTWPVATYPHFQPLKELEDLGDGNRPLLKNAMSNLTNVSELAISVDSGHGWLNGPDISDMAIFRNQEIGGSKVFGKAFAAPDTFHQFALRQYFQWGQLNSLTACVKQLASCKQYLDFKKRDKKFLSRFRVREYDDYLVQNKQLDYNINAHIGGLTPTRPPPPQTVAPSMIHLATPPAQIGAPMAPALAGGWIMPMANNNLLAQPVNAPVDISQTNTLVAAMANSMSGSIGVPSPEDTSRMSHRITLSMFHNVTRRRLETILSQRSSERHGRRDFTWDERFRLDQPPHVPQWPLLFNGYNLAAEVGGSHSFVQNEVAWPGEFPYLPGKLSETQVQWLMETVWAQRAFLSAYANSIISNTVAFKNVHSLHIAKLSSGLISSIAQTDFWTALPNLKKLTLMIIPDWRREHTPGDRDFQRNMSISPIGASTKLTSLLEDFVAKLENLSTLRTGFVGGGEHQTGLFGRNNHVLPAPVTRDPRSWLVDHENTLESKGMLTLNHIRNLTFVNCWFSPLMLETFVRKSRDTSLHHLTLESVSLTGIHDVHSPAPHSHEARQFQCKFDPCDWLIETIPRNACWVKVLENITPGKTILDRRYDARLIDEVVQPRPEPEFKGYVERITLKSCGYVRISAITPDQFCQNGLVEQNKPEAAMDEGLVLRRQIFAGAGSGNTRTVTRGRPLTDHQLVAAAAARDESISGGGGPGGIMLNGANYFGLGRLTQCVHPVEKRVLEQAWGFEFGWGDDLERWAAVEDGCFEGGTGRFGGVLTRDDDGDDGM